MTSTARAIKHNLKVATIIQPINKSQNHDTSYFLPRRWTCTHSRTHTGGVFWRHESDFKKPGARRPQAGARLV